MLVAMAGGDIARSDFQAALDLAGGNITEPGEIEACQQIQRLFSAIQAGDDGLRQQLAQAIVALAERNRVAMNGAARQAQSLGRAGAWSVAFMALLFFTTGIIFEQRLRRDILDPVGELGGALQAHRDGDSLRRCTGIGLSKEMKRVFAEVNDLLDQKTQG